VIPARPQSAGLRDVYVVWVLFFLTAVAVFVTYWRLPPSVLWKVHNTGFIGGAGRAYVFLSFSAAVAAVGILPIVVDRLEDRRARFAGLVALVLCATVALPGVQTESHLDPKWSNLPAVLGVALALGLTFWASRAGRREFPRTSARGDAARLIVGGLSLFFAAPYIAAELGFFLDRVPVLGSIFLTGAIRPEPGAGYSHAAVHHGHHHGMDGFLLAVTALLLSRLVGSIRRPLRRTLTAVYLALLLVYGLTNQVQDLWTEQIVKRGWTSWEIPNVLHPSLSAAWAAMIACGLVIYALFLRPRRGLFARNV
jgi:predicted membrane channel-forming protein YqfA (hemolysin III family)